MFRVIASRILHEIRLLTGEFAIRRTNLTLIVRLGTTVPSNKAILLLELLLIIIRTLLNTVQPRLSGLLGNTQMSPDNRGCTVVNTVSIR